MTPPDWRPWAGALLGGVAGTTAMTLTTALERAVRTHPGEFVDYDASRHVSTAAATVLRIDEGGRRRRRVLFSLTHWGYGSAMALGHEAVRRALPHARPGVPAVVFGLGCQTMAFTLFPTVGGTPPPWRWRRDVLASSLGQHAVYVATVAAVDALCRRRWETPGMETPPAEVVSVVDVPESGRFEIRLDGEAVGLTLYSDDGGVRTFPHTEVDPDQGGHGYGTRLIREALDATRAAGLSVRPTCSMVAAFIDKHPDYADLRVPE